jgi:hypothetical protein
MRDRTFAAAERTLLEGSDSDWKMAVRMAYLTYQRDQLGPNQTSIAITSGVGAMPLKVEKNGDQCSLTYLRNIMLAEC